MRKPNTDPDNVQMSDVLCDFCHREWTDDLPVIEGHQGSIVCGFCLATAFRLVMLDKSGNAPEGYKCVMCLEHRSDQAWQSPAYPEACICKRCVNQAAATLSKDKDYGWQKPQSRRPMRECGSLTLASVGKFQPQPKLPHYEAQARNAALKRLFARLAELERERLDLNEQLVAVLLRDRPEPMTRGQKRTLTDFERSGEQADRELPALIAKLDDDSLYRTARWDVKGDLEFKLHMGTDCYSPSSDAVAIAKRIIANLSAAWELVKSETFVGT